MNNRDVITVGVDGSPYAEAALRWACAYAARNGGRVTAVRAWQDPHPTSAALQAIPGSRQREQLRAEDSLRAVLGSAPPTAAVSSRCALHTHCPVVVVSAGWEALPAS